MALMTVPLPLSLCEIPPEIREFLSEAQRQVGVFVRGRPTPIRGFESSCFESAYRALYEISDRRLSPGNTFCEWGSGFGVIASLAAMLGFRAYGIELDSELCDASRNLAEQFGIPVKFVTGSFIPEGSDKIIDRAYENFEGDLMMDPHSDNTYFELGMDVCDFDLIFAYPWPKDTRLTATLFDRFSSTDALLLTYNGRESMRLQRKRAGSRLKSL